LPGRDRRSRSNQVSIKKKGSTKANVRVPKKTARKMLNIPFWAYLVQSQYLLAIGDGSLLRAIEFDVGFDEPPRRDRHR